MPSAVHTAPATAAANPTVKAALTAQSVSKFATGEISDTYPKSVATIGSVKTVAPIELETLAMAVARSLRARMPLRLNLTLSASYILGDTSTRPSMEANESCKLAEAMLIGLAASNIIRAKDMLVSGRAPS